MEFLGLLFQLLKAPLGIDVDGILGDFALQMALVSVVPHDAGMRRIG